VACGAAAVSERDPLLRPRLHAYTGLCALTLGVLPDPWQLVFAVGGVLIGWVVFPLTALDAKLRRPGEPFLGGLRTYPVAVLALVLLLPRTEAAAAWGVLAFGDAAAAIYGRTLGGPSLFGHAKATWAGSAAYLLVGGLAAWSLGSGVAWLASATGWVSVASAPTLAACFAAALAAAILDLVPLPPDDNLPAAAAAGGVLHLLRILT
jgi:dolichol kinase